MKQDNRSMAQAVWEFLKNAAIIIGAIILLAGYLVFQFVDSQVKTQNWQDGFQKVYGTKPEEKKTK